jgi:hypothetical protein
MARLVSPERFALDEVSRQAARGVPILVEREN